VRARAEFMIPKSGNDPKAPPAPTQSLSMVRDLSGYRDLPLRAAAYTYQGTKPNDVKVVAVADIADDMATLVSAAFTLVDMQGHRAAEWDLSSAELAARPLVSAATVPPGPYRLRVAAIDTAGRRGAADFEFSATLVSALPFELGDLMLGLTGADGAFHPKLVFGDEASATGHLEIYSLGAVPAQPTALSVAIEIARTSDGAALISVPALIGPTVDANRWIARGAVPIGAVPAGDYIVRAIVRVNGVVVGRVVKTVRKAT
jgi:hypothetical protein